MNSKDIFSLNKEIFLEISRSLDEKNLNNFRSGCNFFKNNLTEAFRKELDGKKIKKIVGDRTNTYFLKKNGTVWVCGLCYEDPHKIAEKINDILLDLHGLVMLTNEGDVFIDGPGIKSLFSDINNVKSIASMDYGLNFFHKEDGTVWMMSSEDGNFYGDGKFKTKNKLVQLPVKDINKMLVTKPANYILLSEINGTTWFITKNMIKTMNIKRLPYTHIKSIAANDTHLFFLTNSGKVLMWEIKNLDRIEKIIEHSSLAEIKEMAISCYSLFFLNKNGQVYGCGKNEYGELGLGDQNPRDEITLLNMPSKVKHICIYYNTAYFVSEKGDVYMSGVIPYQWKSGTSVVMQPKKLDNLSDVDKIILTPDDAPEYTFFVSNGKNQLFSWGDDNYNNVLATGKSDTSSPYPADITESPSQQSDATEQLDTTEQLKSNSWCNLI